MMNFISLLEDTNYVVRLFVGSQVKPLFDSFTQPQKIYESFCNKMLPLLEGKAKIPEQEDVVMTCLSTLGNMVCVLCLYLFSDLLLQGAAHAEFERTVVFQLCRLMQLRKDIRGLVTHTYCQV